MVGRPAATAGRLEDEGQLLADPLLPDEFVQSPWPKRGLDCLLVRIGSAVDDAMEII